MHVPTNADVDAVGGPAGSSDEADTPTTSAVLGGRTRTRRSVPAPATVAGQLPVRQTDQAVLSSTIK